MRRLRPNQTTQQKEEGWMNCEIRRGLLVVLSLVASIASVEAKRKAPNAVEPVVIGSVRYSAPSTPEFMGFVIATDVSFGKELWRQRIYNVSINPSLEKDVQWVFITAMRGHGDTLLIGNERGENFKLDLATRKVTKRSR
jgi:hypothetical protein